MKYGDYTYYREYQKDSFEEFGLDDYYEYKENAVKKMVRINEHGEKEELFDDTGLGKIFILNDTMYLTDENSHQLYSVDLHGQNRKGYSYPYGSIIYVDEENSKIIYSSLQDINHKQFR